MAMRTDVGERLLTWLDIGHGPHRALCAAFLEPDLLHWDGPLTQEADLHPLHVGLIEVFIGVVLLGNPWGIVHDDALHLAVERDPLRLIDFPSGLLQQLIHPGIAV